MLQTMPTLESPSHNCYSAVDELGGEGRGGKLLNWDRGAEVITEYGGEARQDGVMESEEAPQSSLVTKFPDKGVEVTVGSGVEASQEESGGEARQEESGVEASQDLVTEEGALAGQSFLQLLPGPGRCLAVLRLPRSGLRECRGLEELQGVMQVSEPGGCAAVNLSSPSWTCPTTSSPCCP